MTRSDDRRERIGRAAEDAFKAQEFWNADWSVIGLAAVRAAYEIDGVDKLVKAAEAMAQELRNITNANPREWGLNSEEVGPEFEMWAKSRCAYTLELHGAAAARRMWKMFKHYADDTLGHVQTPGMDPVTILPGHSAVEEIEREAYERGRQAIIDITMPLLKAETLAIDGVSPVVVDGFIDDRFEVKPWVVGGLLAVFKKNCGKDRPCRVHLYPGIGPDGKRAGGRE